MYYLTTAHGEIFSTNDREEFSKWMMYANRQVKYTKVLGIDVSTVALGLDHQFGDGEPLIFETMIFGGCLDGYCDRYSTIEEAKVGHRKAVWKTIITLSKSLLQWVISKLSIKKDDNKKN